jgi:enoyl-CoA hydratase/carnithine racemase
MVARLAPMRQAPADGRIMAGAPVQVETVGHVAVLRMTHGKANALDLTLCRAITASLAELASGGGHRAVVLTAGGPIFSAGVDLLRIRDGGPAYVEEFLPVLCEAFLAVFDCPLPVVAAVNGHAIAGGCILVSACDRRVMNAGAGRIGVSELLVGVPFPPAALEILRFAVGTCRLQELTHLAQTYAAAEAAALGLVDEVASGDSVLERAIEVAAALAALPQAALRQTRIQIRRPTLDHIAREAAAEETVRGIWKSPAAQEAIAGYVRRVLHHN